MNTINTARELLIEAKKVWEYEGPEGMKGLYALKALVNDHGRTSWSEIYTHADRMEAWEDMYDEIYGSLPFSRALKVVESLLLETALPTDPDRVQQIEIAPIRHKLMDRQEELESAHSLTYDEVTELEMIRGWFDRGESSYPTDAEVELMLEDQFTELASEPSYPTDAEVLWYLEAIERLALNLTEAEARLISDIEDRMKQWAATMFPLPPMVGSEDLLVGKSVMEDIVFPGSAPGPLVPDMYVSETGEDKTIPHTFSNRDHVDAELPEDEEDRFGC